MHSLLPPDPLTQSLLLVGPVLEKPLPSSFLKGIPRIAIDGGINFAGKPLFWIGDGDSGKSKRNQKIILKTNQNETDLRYCLNQIEDWKWQELHLAGFLGGRQDHELGNFGEIYSEMKSRRKFQKSYFYNDINEKRVFFIQTGEYKIEIKGTFSLISFENTKITLNGKCTYKCKDLTLPPFSGRGISNQGAGLVKITTSKPLMVVI